MAFIPISNAVKVAVEYLLDGQEVANIFNVDVGATVTTAIMDAILDVFVTWLTGDLVPALSEDLAVTALTARDMTTQTGALIERPLDPFIVGGVASGAGPNNSALCVTHFTDQSGRSYRGRSYVPGLPEADATISRVSAGKATEFAEIFINLVNDINTAGYDLIVASLYSLGVPRVTGVKTPIIAMGCNTVLDSQRRRLPGRGT